VTAARPAKRLSAAEQRRASQLDDVRQAVDDLARQVRTAALHTRDKGIGLDGVNRGAPTQHVHRTRQPGLVAQLDASPLLGAVKGARYDQGAGHAKPTSRPPLDLSAMDLLADMATGVRAWRQRLGGRGRRPLVGELRALTGLSHCASDLQLRELLDDLRSWVRTARVALAYDAGPVDLPDFVCPDCGGGLKVLADASSDVWCAGGLPMEGPALAWRGWPLRTRGCGATWPRGQWVLLLEQAELVEG
jgi:hypothetical protein